MDSNGLACISDYGLEIVLCDEACTKPIQPNIRWIAPEVLVTKRRYVPPGEDGKTADIYSFGMVVFEVRLSCLYSTLELYLNVSPLDIDRYYPVPN